jgi:GntR family transcriptional regulator, arabinose operon transcriptional repressor
MPILDGRSKDPLRRDGKVKFRAIRDAVRREIESGLHTPGERLPTDDEIAERFATSRLTVIRALRELETEGLVKRKAGSGTFVRTAPSAASLVFGLLIPDLREGEVFEPICRGIARAAESMNQTLLWGDLGTQAQKKEEQAEFLCRYFISRKVAGVFFAPVELSAHQQEVNEHISASLDEARIPVVLIDREFRKYPERSRYDLVGIDNCWAGYRMARHLLDSGCRRIVFTYRPGSAPTVDGRYAGYREALWKAKMEPLEPLIYEGEGGNDDIPKEFLRTVRPDGFLCANDLTAAMLMHSLIKAGVRIPEHARIAGLNDVRYAQFLPVPLTTLRQPCAEIGAAAMSTMLERLKNPKMPARDVSLSCEIIVRQSTGGVSSTSTAGD